MWHIRRKIFKLKPEGKFISEVLYLLRISETSTYKKSLISNSDWASTKSFIHQVSDQTPFVVNITKNHISSSITTNDICSIWVGNCCVRTELNFNSVSKTKAFMFTLTSVFCIRKGMLIHRTKIVLSCQTTRF